MKLIQTYDSSMRTVIWARYRDVSYAIVNPESDLADTSPIWFLPQTKQEWDNWVATLMTRRVYVPNTNLPVCK